jgi:DNA-binding CsgD family transcriptional regulator
MDNDPLTPRENEILALVRAGRSSKEIARELGITRSTVRCHVQRVLTKLGVASRLQAAAISPPQSDAISPPLSDAISPPPSTVVSPPSPAAVAARPPAGSHPPDPPPSRISGLTPRETQVLRCIAVGIGRAEIARHLFMSPHTARTHIQRILAKLDVHSALAAMACAHRAGLAPQESA